MIVYWKDKYYLHIHLNKSRTDHIVTIMGQLLLVLFLGYVTAGPCKYNHYVDKLFLLHIMD